jgi:hypothetical protein
MANLRPGKGNPIKKSKAEADYKLSQACKNCDNYYNTGLCQIVEGSISPNATCNFWEAIESRSPYRDKEFFQKEYERSE